MSQPEPPSHSEQPQGTATKYCCGSPSCQMSNPTSILFRVVVLICSCCITFGSYYAYDNPGALTAAFKSQLCLNSTTNYELMYSVYSMPNTVQPFIGGLLIDRFLGLRGAAILFSLLVALGAACCALAASLIPSFAPSSNVPFIVAVVGRVIFGLGGESLTVAQSTFTAKWFSGKELATAFAITLSFSRVGSAVNFAIAPRLMDSLSFASSLWISAGFCFFSFAVAIVLARLDLYGERKGAVKAAKSDEDAKLSDVVKVLHCSEVLLYLICVFFYVAVFAFITIAGDFFKTKWPAACAPPKNVTYLGGDTYQACTERYNCIWKVSQSAIDHAPKNTPAADLPGKCSPSSWATDYVALPYTISAILSPLLGFAIDKVGRSLVWVIIATAFLTGIHLCLATLMVDPLFEMIWLGVAYSLCAAGLWPMVALLVDIDQLGTAYGFMTALQNAGLALAPLVVGHILDTDGGGSSSSGGGSSSSGSGGGISNMTGNGTNVTNGTGGSGGGSGGHGHGQVADLSQFILVEYVFAGCAAASFVFAVLLGVLNGCFRDGILLASADDVMRIQAKKLKAERLPLIAGEDGGLSPYDPRSQVLSPKTSDALRREYLRKLNILNKLKGPLS